MTPKQFAACKKAILAWGVVYVLGPNDRPPNSYWMDCEAVKWRRARDIRPSPGVGGYDRLMRKIDDELFGKNR